MDENNYVSPDPNGGFMVVVDGQVVTRGVSQGEAERAFNTARGQANAPTAPTRPGSGYDWPGYGRALASMNQQDFDETVRQFNEQLAQEAQRLGLSRDQFEELKRQFNLNTYTGLATAILQGATSLRGPESWPQYGEFISGGRDIFKALYGDQPAPAFGAPTGYSKPASITGILADLGIPQAPGAGGTATPGGMSEDASLDWIWANRPDLANFYGSNGWDVSTPQAQRAAARNWISQADPSWKGMTAQQVAGKLGYQPASAAAAPAQVGGPYQPSPTAPGQTPPQPEKIGQGDSNPYMVPLPHQVNPAVWDSYSPTVQKMILASAEKGNTSSGAWDAGDYLRQLNAARPQGIAPRRVNFNWGNANSLF